MGVKAIVRIDPGKILRKRGLGSNGKAQKFLSSEIARKANPYVPFRSGNLKNIQVRVLSNCIIYYAPYAKKQYYDNTGNGKQGTNKGGLRGKLWIPRMWADHGQEIIKSVADFVGGKAR